MSHHIPGIRNTALAVVVTFVACAATASPAPASPTRNDDREGGAGTDPSYARPLDALGGMTLAQYLERHQAGDPRTAAVV